MGKQIDFYMTAKDRDAFLATVQEIAPSVVALRDSDLPDIAQANERQISSGKTLVLWNTSLSSRVNRKWVPESGYFRIDTLREPVLEYMPSFTTTWKGKAAIGQGRLYGNFESYLGKPDNFKKWYESLAWWIQKNYRKNSGKVGGFLGPEAQQLAVNGHYLLPGFTPPETSEWETELRGVS